jgi:hypothetical protein
MSGGLKVLRIVKAGFAGKPFSSVKGFDRLVGRFWLTANGACPTSWLTRVE